jgi:hypothetical protein
MFLNQWRRLISPLCLIDVCLKWKAVCYFDTPCLSSLPEDHGATQAHTPCCLTNMSKRGIRNAAAAGKGQTTPAPAPASAKRLKVTKETLDDLTSQTNLAGTGGTPVPASAHNLRSPRKSSPAKVKEVPKGKTKVTKKPPSKKKSAPKTTASSRGNCPSSASPAVRRSAGTEIANGIDDSDEHEGQDDPAAVLQLLRIEKQVNTEKEQRKKAVEADDDEAIPDDKVVRENNAGEDKEDEVRDDEDEVRDDVDEVRDDEDEVRDDEDDDGTEDDGNDEGEDDDGTEEVRGQEDERRADGKDELEVSDDDEVYEEDHDDDEDEAVLVTDPFPSKRKSDLDTRDHPPVHSSPNSGRNRRRSEDSPSKDPPAEENRRSPRRRREESSSQHAPAEEKRRRPRSRGEKSSPERASAKEKRGRGRGRGGGRGRGRGRSDAAVSLERVLSAAAAEQRGLSPTRQRKSTQDIGEKATLLAEVRMQFSDIIPHEPPLPPFIYWDPAVSYSCAAKLIARVPELQDMAATYDRPLDLAKKWAQVVRTQANNERSTQIRVIKSVWMDNASEWSFSNVDLESEPNTIQLAEPLKLEDTLNDITDLQRCLYSDSFYKNKTLYHFFCSGLEGGSFKNIPKQEKSTISDLITPAHEAHFRAELYFALSVPEYRHPITKQHSARRIAMWQKFLPLVKKDRHENESNASAIRANMTANGTNTIQTIDDTTLDNPDPTYW